MNHQSYPNYDLELLNSYKNEIESILQELIKIKGNNLLIQKVNDLRLRIDSDIEQIQIQGRKIVPEDE